MTRRLLERLHREEQGGVIIFVVGFLGLVAIPLMAWVIDVGNGMEHRRHLQTQADAGALAAAQEFSGCFLMQDQNAANTAIEEQALDYSGAVHNEQIGPPDAQSRVDPRINATDYNAASYSDGTPCETGVIDVKLTEKDAPPFFPFFGNKDYKAHARIQWFRLSSSNKLVPIAAEDPTPRAARAIFVNETTGETLADVPLKRNGRQGGLAIWDNSEAPVPVPIKSDAQHVGVRIALSGSTSTTCGSYLVVCYDTGAPNQGLLHIQGWSAEGTVTQSPPTGPQSPPLPRSVWLDMGTCADPYFSSATTTCKVNVRARVDFGNDHTKVGARLFARVAGTRYPMTYDSVTQSWFTGPAVTVPAAGANAAPRDVALEWEETAGKVGTKTCKSNDPCTGSFGVQQRVFVSNPSRSGNIALAEVSEGTVARTNSLERGTTPNLVVKIGLAGTLELSSVSDLPVRLRVADGSQTQSVDCDPAVNQLRDELANGCSPSYTVNTGTACPGSLGSTPQPWSCVAAETGSKTGHIGPGLNKRVFGDDKAKNCTSPNHWGGDIPPNDPRIVYVFVTPVGSFDGSGNDTKPVLGLAAFYLTGWDQDPCAGDDEPNDKAEIVGRFIKYVDIPTDGGASDDTCDPKSIDICAAVLVE